MRARHCPRLLLLPAALLLLLGQVTCKSSDLPHISKCSICKKCVVDEPLGKLIEDMPLKPDGWKGPKDTLGGVDPHHHRRLLRTEGSAQAGATPAARPRGWKPEVVGAANEGMAALARTLLANAYDLDHDEELDLGDAAQDVAPKSGFHAPSGRSLKEGTQVGPPHNDEEDLHPDSQAAYLAHLLRPLDEDEKKKLPACEECRGCNMELEHVERRSFKLGDIEYYHQAGSMKNWIFWTKVEGEQYIVKVYNQDLGRTRRHHTPRLYGQAVQAQYSYLAIAKDCGVLDMYPRMWMVPINAAVPEIGYHVRFHVILYQVANGIPLHDLLHMVTQRGRRLKTPAHGPEIRPTVTRMQVQRKQPREPLVRMLDTGLNSTQIVITAAMDLFTSMCDRHKGNMIIAPSGAITLIDPERSLGIYPGCGWNSVVMPGSRTLNREVLKLYGYDAFSDDPITWPSGMCAYRAVAFSKYDYRCHVTGGIIGTTNYPKSIEKCMTKTRDSSVDELVKRYGLPDWQAKVLKDRATDMMTKGYEWTMEHGEPKNEDRFLVPTQPPCCDLEWATQEPWPVCKNCWKAVKPQRPS